MGIFALFLFLPTGKQGRGVRGSGGPGRRPWGLDGDRVGGEKGGGGHGGSIPGPTSGWDGARRWGDEGRRRWVEVVAAAALQGQEGARRS